MVSLLHLIRGFDARFTMRIVGPTTHMLRGGYHSLRGGYHAGYHALGGGAIVHMVSLALDQILPDGFVHPGGGMICFLQRKLPVHLYCMHYFFSFTPTYHYYFHSIFGVFDGVVTVIDGSCYTWYMFWVVDVMGGRCPR